jgi:membrane protein YqaA with SNARE-associated domain
VKLGPIALLHKFSAALFAVLKPLGIWGVGGLALLDSALIPIPGSMDSVIVGYVHAEPHRFFLFCLMAAGASTLGSLVPFYIGRAGGELFLLKRIDRSRYERLRDRFEKQEFFAILIPSMGPPPTPLKVFQFAAGVFEMRPGPFLLATFCGKMTQYLVFSLLTIWFGPALIHNFKEAIRDHHGAVVGISIAAVLALLFFIVRKVFDRRKGEVLPGEEALPPSAR